MLKLVTANYKPEVESIKVLTPRTSLSFVVVLSDIGYLDSVETYPVAAELNEGYLFVSHEEDTGKFIVSEFVNNDFRWAPYGEFNNFQEALVEFKKVYAERLIP